MKKTEGKCYVCGVESSQVHVIEMVCGHDLCFYCSIDRLKVIQEKNRLEAVCSLCSEASPLEEETIEAVEKYFSQNGHLSSASSISSSKKLSLPGQNQQQSPKNGTNQKAGGIVPFGLFPHGFPLNNDKQNIINAIENKLMQQNELSNSRNSRKNINGSQGEEGNEKAASKMKRMNYKGNFPSFGNKDANHKGNSTQKPGSPSEFRSHFDEATRRGFGVHQNGIKKKKKVSFAKIEEFKEPLTDSRNPKQEEASGMAYSADHVRNPNILNNFSPSDSENSTNRGQLSSGLYDDSTTQRKSENSLVWGLPSFQKDQTAVPSAFHFDQSQHHRKPGSLEGVVEGAVREIRIIIHNGKQIKHCLEECKMLIEQLEANIDSVRDKKQFSFIKQELEYFFMKNRGISLLASQEQLRSLMVPLQMESRALTAGAAQQSGAFGSSSAYQRGISVKKDKMAGMVWQSVNFVPGSFGNDSRSYNGSRSKSPEEGLSNTGNSTEAQVTPMQFEIGQLDAAKRPKSPFHVQPVNEVELKKQRYRQNEIKKENQTQALLFEARAKRGSSPSQGENQMGQGPPIRPGSRPSLVNVQRMEMNPIVAAVHLRFPLSSFLGFQLDRERQETKTGSSSPLK